MRPLARTLSAAAAAVLAGALTVACGSDPDTAAAGSTSDTRTVTIGTLRGQPHFYAPFLYDEHAQDDVSYEVVTLDTTPALNDALVSGSVDFAITGITATIGSNAQGRDLKVVAAAADGGSGFVGDESVETVQDLVGKKLGYLPSSSQDVAMRLTLEQAGVDVDDVQLVKLAAPEFFSAFDTGQIDAFFGPEIGVSLALAAGGHEITSPYETPIARLNIALVTTGELVEQDPELVQSVVDTHVATTAYMADNQAEWLPGMVSEYGGDEAVFDSALENFWLRADLSPDYQQQIGNLVDQMHALELITAKPALDDVVDDSFAPAEQAS